MGLLDKIMGYGEIKEPEFKKDFNKDDNSQLQTLLALLEKVDESSKERVERELLYVNSGLSGENNVYYELKNSRMPLVCLHDIRLEHNSYEAQFDFIVIASSFILAIETKKMYGNISIDNEGNFTREFYIKNRNIKEGMYSPVTQNDRHIKLLDEFLRDMKLIKRCPIFSLVVVANEKTVVDKKSAKKEVQDLIIKHDQLIERLYQLEKDNSALKMKHSHMRDISDVIFDNNKPKDFDFVGKLKLVITAEKETVVDEIEVKESVGIKTPLASKVEIMNVVEEPKTIEYTSEDDVEDDTKMEGTKLFKALRYYRFNKAKKVRVKPYFIFNNSELEDLVSIRPTDKKTFIAIPGFGEKKFELYGNEIVKIINTTLEKLAEELKQYRKEKAISYKLKAYEVFNNQQLDEIIKIQPRDLEELKGITYYKQTQIDQFGPDIIDIISKNR